MTRISDGSLTDAARVRGAGDTDMPIYGLAPFAVFFGALVGVSRFQHQ